MEGILNILNSSVGKSVIKGVSDATGVDSEKTSSAMSMAMPVLMKAMERNASTPEGAASLMGALNGKHDGSILDNIGGMFSSGINKDVTDEGTKILGHVLGGKQKGIEQIIGQKSGLDAASVGNILKVSAPILMGFLGKEARQNNVSAASGLGGLFGGLLGGASQSGPVTNEQTLLDKMLDADGDGSLLDGIASSLLGGGKKRGGLGGLLGSVFGK